MPSSFWHITTLVSVTAALAACSTPQTAEEIATQPDHQVADLQAHPEVVVIGTPCKSVTDCDSTTTCIPTVECVAGVCEYTYANIGAPCEEGCFINGSCDGDGSCTNLMPKECPETDGNICTVPTCTPDTGECGEQAIEDGLPPYVSSDCVHGAICIDGEQDNDDAQPSELALECEAMGDDLDPFGCIDGYICVGGDDPCKPVFKVDDSPCWTAGEDDDCTGHSCQAGECTVDHELDAECTEDDFPDECDSACQACTQLTCHWIPDPANPDAPSKKVRYCKPEAKAGFACTEDPCLLGQVCGLGSQANGPLGKETLGSCSGGQEKSKEQCLDELGKSPLDCLLAGVACDAEQGCHINQDIADKWCWPPDWKCFDKNDTYCTHLDSGDNWNPDNGCHTAWVDLNCDDNNDCTVDLCKVDGEKWKCEHQPIDGAGCDDGDPCTVGGVCVEGQCAQHTAKCQDDDDNPCNDPSCDPFSGECKPAQTNSYPCNDANACTIGDTCQDLVCQSGAAKNCDDGNPCTDDYCDPAQGCLHDNNVLPCDDGDASTVDDTCANGQCQPGPPIACDDNNPCTNDLPDANMGCKYTDASGPCTDNDVCTDGDACAGGECVPGPAVDCDDNTYCTVDSCHPVQGCQHDDLPDYTPCPGGANYGCIDGECLCQPECGSNECGSDGCGGSCGTCGDGLDCLNGKCYCVPDCTGKSCGDDGCAGTCGTCQNGQQCVAGQCQGDGFDPNGTYALSDLVYHQCGEWLGDYIVKLNYSQLTFSQSGGKLYVNPSMNGCCAMEGSAITDGNFSVSCWCPGGGVCDETYSLSGSFTDDTHWTATFTAQYSGALCLGCTFYSTTITGSLQ